MEQGIANAGVLICHEVEENETSRLDHTWQEIVDAGFAVVIENGNITTLMNIYQEEGANSLAFGGGLFPRYYVSLSADDYPVLDTSSGGGNDNPATS